MEIEQYLRTTSLMELLHANGCGLYGLLGAFIGCWFIRPSGVREFLLRIFCGFAFSFALTPLAGPLMGGFVESTFGQRAAEGLYEAPASIGVIIGLVAYYVASFVVVVARNTQQEAWDDQKTYLDYRPEPEVSPYNPPPPDDTRPDNPDGPPVNPWDNGPWGPKQQELWEINNTTATDSYVANLPNTNVARDYDER